METVSVAVLNAVVPPLVETSTAVSPSLPEVWSQARTVIVAPPLKSASGTKRMSASGASNTAELSETAPKAVQLAPPLVEYCQVPLASSTPMTATPSSAPESASEIGSPPAPVARIADTVSPAGATVSSSIAVRTGEPESSSTGASLTALTVMEIDWVVRLAPSLTSTSTS